MKNLTNQNFGRLIAIEPTKKRCGSSIIWKCICRCGNIHYTSSHSLRSNKTQSCGCIRREQLIERCTKHNMTKSHEYFIWQEMKKRCQKPNHKDYYLYGGRGISVSDEFYDFQTWYEHIGPQPQPGYSQDRIDNNGNYERGNIRWATPKEQANNRRPRNSCRSVARFEYGRSG